MCGKYSPVWRVDPRAGYPWSGYLCGLASSVVLYAPVVHIYSVYNIYFVLNIIRNLAVRSQMHGKIFMVQCKYYAILNKGGASMDLDI